jgi:hypothetical protein
LIPTITLYVVAFGSFFAASFMAWRIQFRDSNRFKAEINDYDIIPRLVSKPDSKGHPEVYLSICGNHGDATDLQFQFDDEINRLVEERRWVNKVQIPTILAGQIFQWRFILGIGDPHQHNASWSWRSKDGKNRIRKGIIRIEFLS